MSDKEKKYSDEEVEKIVKDFFDNMISVLSFLPQNFYEEILGEVKHRRALVNSMERIMIPAEERRDFRAYSISKIIKREAAYDRSGSETMAFPRVLAQAGKRTDRQGTSRAL